jgi:peptidyl-prolyl isomerase F (cyclophilin D)
MSLLTWASTSIEPYRAVVFGSVVEGMGVVKRMEAMGSQSGVTSRRVVIADCGELESGLQRVLKLKAERDALAASKKDPLGVDLDAAAICRLRALRGEVPDASAAPLQDQPHRAMLETAAKQSQPQDGASGAALEVGGQREAPGDGDAAALHSYNEEEGGEAEDTYEGMSGRQKRLLELRAKSAKARKANEHASVAEFKRLKKGPPDRHMERKKWLDTDAKERKVQAHGKILVHSGGRRARTLHRRWFLRLARVCRLQ